MFRSCISKINSTLTENSEDCGMLMYNVLEQYGNYSMRSEGLRNYIQDKINNVNHNTSQRVNKSSKDKKNVIT